MKNLLLILTMTLVTSFTAGAYASLFSQVAFTSIVVQTQLAAVDPAGQVGTAINTVNSTLGAAIGPIYYQDNIPGTGL